MSIPLRLRAILVIVLTSLLIILFSVLTGIWYVNNSIRASQETDLSLVADIANHVISNEIELLKLKASIVVKSLSDAAETQWPEMLAFQETQFPEFAGMAVLDEQMGVIASAGEAPPTSEIIDDVYIQRAFKGSMAISSTKPSGLGMAFYIAAPLTSLQDAGNRIVAITLPGMHFSRRVSSFVIWETGHIFMTDAQGNMIANMRENWVQTRINFFEMSETDSAYEQVAAVLERVVNGETGVGYFPMAGVPRLCSFTPVSASEEGWGMGIIAPLPESPFRDIDRGLIVVGIVAVFLSVVASIFFSRFVIKPFDEITKLKEAAEINSKYKSNFLASMSHELRTPMNAIIGMSELALSENEINAAHDYIQTVKQAGVNLLSIINDLLDFSKIEKGTLSIAAADYSLDSLINDVINVIRIKVLEKRLRFVVNIDSNIPGTLIGDDTRIRQVILNLLGNAVKYTESGFVSLTIRHEMNDHNEICLNIDVEDSGIGIKPENINDLFEAYTRFDMERNKGIEGAGLGLMITKNIVSAMDGSITVASEYGRGSKFSVSIPQRIRSINALATVLQRDNKRILVYERRKLYADSIIYSANSLGVECLIVSGENELLESVAGGKYEFIFIPLAVFERNKRILLDKDANVNIIVLMDFGETVPELNCKVKHMPLHSISIANTLNGIAESCTSGQRGRAAPKFTAPEVRILIVDDVGTNLRVAEGLLIKFNMKTDTCLSGQAAVELVKNNIYDIIFMDHFMPGMDGIEATKMIRSLKHENDYYANVPIIALTANAISGMKETFLKNGFNDFISKPIDTAELSAALVRWIPEAKIISAANTPSEESKTTTMDAPAGIEITGIDVNTGISRSGGKLELYLEILAAFREDAMELSKKMKSCIDSNDISLYTTHVHALKSAAANIGALDLSEAAAALEMAGERKDMEYIRARNEGLLVDLADMLNSIERTI